MGGLLVKEMLCQMEEDKEENSKSNSTSAKCILEQTKGVVFFSVPNLGSEMAVWSPHMQRIISPSAQVLELRKGKLKIFLLSFVNLIIFFHLRQCNSERAKPKIHKPQREQRYRVSQLR